jgi:poly(ADP-ribose) glycohydrolase ARH3
MVEETGLGYVQTAGRLFDGEGSMGNGAAMRVAPVGLFYAGTGRVYGMAARSAEVTHTHPLGRDGAGVLATAVAKAALCSPEQKLDPIRWAEDLAETARTEEFTEAMERMGELLEKGAGRREAAERLGTGVLIHRSVPYAVWCFLQASGSFEDCLMNAILAGGDRDTIGAMACAISGSCLGAGAVPAQWLERLENGDYIRNLAHELHILRSQVTL